MWIVDISKPNVDQAWLNPIVNLANMDPYKALNELHLIGFQAFRDPSQPDKDLALPQGLTSIFGRRALVFFVEESETSQQFGYPLSLKLTAFANESDQYTGTSKAMF